MKFTDEEIVKSILEEYKDELDKTACDRCEDCGKLIMCRFHSVLSLLQRHTYAESLWNKSEVNK